MEQPSAPPTNTSATAKRKRASQACQNCRVAKRRCDAVRPSCGSCANSSTLRACVYDGALEARTKQSRLIQRLQERIANLERADEGRKGSSTDYSGQVPNSFRPGSRDSNATTVGSAAHGEEFAHTTKDKGDHAVASSTRYSEARTGQRWDANLVTPSPTSTHTSQASKGLGVSAMAIPPSFSQNDSPQLGTANTSRSQIHDSAAFEHDENYLDHREELPPNDEIGVVEPRFGYFGDSSAVTFMSQVRSVLDNAEDWSGHDDTEPASPAPLPRESSGIYLEMPQAKRLNGSRRLADLQLYALPGRESADALLEVFWTWVHSLYPYLDRPDFEQKYEKIWLASGTGDGASQAGAFGPKQDKSQGERTAAAELGEKKTFYCTLNIAFALGCQFDPALNPGGSRLSDVFWQRAKCLIEQDFNIFNEGSISLIQALLLFGVYMQSTELSGGCWTVANVATSVAQINGVHQINSGLFSASFSQKEIALRKRIWGGCILLDRSLSMIYGRPSIMTSRAWVDDDFNSPATRSERSTPKSGCESLSYSEFFQHNLALHDILGAILAEFYEKPPTADLNAAIPSSDPKRSNPNTFRAPVFIRRVSEGDFQSLLRFDTALLRWKSQLPAFLKVSLENDANLNSGRPSTTLGIEIAQQQAAVLHARFLHIRILLFRPLLLRTLADFRKQSHDESAAKEKSTLHEMLLMQSSVLCISAAQELSKMISSNLERENTRLPEWWHVIFYLYTCATVIIASRCCTPLRERIGETALQACWTECLDGLRVYQQHSRSARRCCRLLEIFDQQTKNVPRPASESEPATSSLREERQVNARMMDMTDDLDLTNAPFSVEEQNAWPFDGFQAAQSANSLDAYFNSWSPNSTDIAFLTAIPFDSGLYPQ